MKAVFSLCLIATVCLWWAQPAPAQSAADAALPAGAEVLTRGPVHEAFAQPASTGAASTLIVPKKPPEAIDEIPPDSKPAGENAVWISGYWGWDDDRKDFLWVSGVWRVPPPNQRWVAGYWTPASGGFQWAPGFWTPVAEQEVEYFPEPPASLEQGPTSEAPSAEYVWIPGCWRWHASRYAWRPGYWGAAQSDWVWSPASYYWSPRGWVYCDGYWDYPLTSRGLLFAPVRFGPNAYHGGRFAYSPSVVIDAGILSFYFFARPSYSHYYFGDYYAASYDGLGIFPWFGVRSYRGYHYDPLFSYYQWRNQASDPQWATNLRGWHTYYRQNADQRPPQTLSAQQQLIATAVNRPDRAQLTIADTLANVGRKPNAFVQLATVPTQEKVRLKESLRLTEEFKTRRAQLEGKAAVAGGASPGKPAEAAPGAALKAPMKLALPKLPALGASQEATPRIGTRPDMPGFRAPGRAADEGAQPARPGRPGSVMPGLTPKPDVVPQPQVIPRETPRATPRETPQVIPRETPRATPRERPQAIPRETPRAVPRETPQAVPRQAPQAVPRESPRIERQQSAPAERRAPEGGRGQGRGGGGGGEGRGREKK